MMKWRYSADRAARGFTLIELLIVVAIIAILAAIAVPNFLESQARAKISASKANHRAYMTGIEAYRVDHNGAPPPGPQLCTAGDIWYMWRNHFQFGLTTPVPYMSRALEDPLWKLSNMFGQTYFYEYHLIDNNIGKALLNEQSTPGMWTRVTKAMMNSSSLNVGWVKSYREGMFKRWNRDNANMVLLGRGPAGMNGNMYTYNVMYDPTNGTVSAGEILSHW